MGGRGIMGNGGMVAPPPPMLHPGGMLGQGFDPTGYGAAMEGWVGVWRISGGPGSAPFPGLMQPFPPVVAPHVNPAFFGRGGGMGAGGVGCGQTQAWVAGAGRSKQAMVMMQHLTSNMVRVGAMVLVLCSANVFVTRVYLLQNFD
ncbi:hypothetical protein GUJ93_ZPchr0009g73 [Zizania palustris]|uniref:Uncharacterized protein n=1 Tax=Zizania palustris TaxID=103762 RepID=A0A8J5V391_ZIZPA|nr:hypothetical protein GUJ93_ZPchr0009g73 [Zizania palustris]